MSLFNGESLSVEIFGESHAEKIGAIVKGLPEFEIDFNKLSSFTQRRKASGGVFSTSRIETDEPVFEGLNDKKTTSNFSFYIKNNNVKSGDYNSLYGRPRPSHADYAWFLKDGVLDFSGGGRFSGRLTAPLCVVGGICKQFLESKGIKIASYISQIGKIKGDDYKKSFLTYDDIVERTQGFPSLSEKQEMLDEIAAAKNDLNSVGGRVDCVIFGVPTGIGDNLFGGVEGKISSLVYSIPAVKGVEFGLGFGFSEIYGDKANDQLFYENGKVKFSSNNSGGINGGITNGEQITFSVAFRPTPSIYKEQNTVDLVNKQSVKIKIQGRHDACIVPRAVPCVESAAAIALTDMILKK
ncbi:MAG: chorismate synthase [Clostridia bacterium]|nr:chorismate synthase [Clostridia bacterium]